MGDFLFIAPFRCRRIACDASTVALPELSARGYDKRLVAGSLAAGGTLGILIPPAGFISGNPKLANSTVSSIMCQVLMALF